MFQFDGLMRPYNVSRVAIAEFSLAIWGHTTNSINVEPCKFCTT